MERDNDFRRETLHSVLRNTPPLWGLRDFVAVNPFVGESSKHFFEAACERKKVIGHSTLPNLDFFRGQWRKGRLKNILAHSELPSVETSQLRAILESSSTPPSKISVEGKTLIERYDEKSSTQYQWEISRWIGKMCSAFEAGGKYWQGSAGSSLYEFFRGYLRADRTLEILGIAGMRGIAQHLPESAETALEMLSEHHSLEEKYLKRLLFHVSGWASYFRKKVWGKEEGGFRDLFDLSVILMLLDKEVSEILRVQNPSEYKPQKMDSALEDNEGAEEERYQLLCLAEKSYLSSLQEKMRSEQESTRPPAEIQAVFCIDVRSEPMRRALESSRPGIETLGFAGFFGLPLSVLNGEDRSARCPVLLSPQYDVCLGEQQGSPPDIGLNKDFKKSGSVPLSYVEYCGWIFGLEIFKDLLAARSVKDVDQNTVTMSESLIQLIPKEERAKIAFQILKNASFGERFAETIVFVGHCSTHANHTQFAGLQCGACGGHGGGVNARIAAELLNNKSVREELREMGYSLPDSTIFLSGVHDTTLENIQLHSSSDLDGDKIRDLQELFEQASRKVQAGRNSQEIPSEAKRRKSFLRKSQDWSETRPEWGLARNAAFLAARRSRTRLVDLEGRVFLHEYDSERDPDGSVLSLILSAPVVVASWINLQYYASTVDNRRFGTGSKTLHNRVGEVGVVSGNGGDLRTGLSEQSVYDTSGEWYHEPLRLQVIVEAPLEKVQTALLGQKNVLDLVANEWIRLFALERESTRLHPVLAVTER